MRTVKYCDSFEAEVIKGRLESEGIPACVINEYASLVLPQVGGVPGGPQAQVVVADEDYNRAVELIAGVPAAEGVVLCPACGSGEVKFGLWCGRKGIRKLLMILALPLALIGGMAAGKMRSRYYCKKCGAEFNP